MHFFRIYSILVLILLNLSLLSCQKHERQESTQTMSWSLKSWDGTQEFKSSQFKDSLTLLSFWATWCTSCQLEIPILKDLHKELNTKGLRIISINLDENPTQVLPKYLKGTSYPFPIYLPNSNLEESIGIPMAMPTLYLIDRSGHIIQKWTGAQTLHQLRSEITPLL